MVNLKNFIKGYRVFSNLPDTPAVRGCLNDLYVRVDGVTDTADLKDFHDWMAEYIYGTILSLNRCPQPEGSDDNDTRVMSIIEEVALLLNFFSELDYAVWAQWER